MIRGIVHSARPRRLRRARHVVVSAVVVVVAALGATPAGAECTTSICTGATCTINGTHDLDSPCTLDFSGQAVTVDANAILRTTPGGQFMIRAKSRVMNGLLKASNGGITITVDGAFSMIASGSLIDTSSTKNGEWGLVDITAGGTATLRKIVTSGVGWGGDLEVEAGVGRRHKRMISRIGRTPARWLRPTPYSHLRDTAFSCGRTRPEGGNHTRTYLRATD